MNRGQKGLFAQSSCQVGVQHWWWGIHILDLVTIAASLTYLVISVAHAVGLTKVAGARKSKLKSKSKLKLKPKQIDKVRDTKVQSVSKGEVEVFEDGDTYENNTFPRRNLKKKRSKRSLSGSAEPETPTRRPLSSAFETPVSVATEDRG